MHVYRKLAHRAFLAGNIVLMSGMALACSPDGVTEPALRPNGMSADVQPAQIMYASTDLNDGGYLTLPTVDIYTEVYSNANVSTWTSATWPDGDVDYFIDSANGVLDHLHTVTLSRGGCVPVSEMNDGEWVYVEGHWSGTQWIDGRYEWHEGTHEVTITFAPVALYTRHKAVDPVTGEIFMEDSNTTGDCVY